MTSPKTVSRRVLISSGAAALASSIVPLLRAASSSKIAFEHALPDLEMKNWAVTVVEVTYPPGQASASHRHPGITVAYVLEGEIRSRVGDGPEKTYRTGEAFIETPNQLHAVSANASDSKQARLLAVLFAEKGKQLTTPA